MGWGGGGGGGGGGRIEMFPVQDGQAGPVRNDILPGTTRHQRSSPWGFGSVRSRTHKFAM